MYQTAEQLQKMTDATKACEELNDAAEDGLDKEVVTNISLMFQRGNDYIEIDVPLSLRAKVIALVRPLLEQEREKALSGLTT